MPRHGILSRSLVPAAMAPRSVTRCLLEKMKKALSMLCGHPQCGEEIVHAESEVFVMVIDRGGMVRFGR